MKHAWKQLAAALMVLSCLPSLASAEGKELRFYLADGKEVKGELLSVRSGSFMVARHAGRLEEELRAFPDVVMELPAEKVVRVEFPGRSNVLLGMGLGFLGGALIGGGLAAASADDPDNLGEAIAEPFNVMGGVTVGALIGLGIGTVVGLTTSSDDQVVDIGNLPNLEYFKQYARYRDQEPDYLGGISR